MVLYEKVLKIPSKNDEKDEATEERVDVKEGKKDEKTTKDTAEKKNEEKKQKKKSMDLNNILTSDIGRCQEIANMLVKIVGNFIEISIAIYFIYSKVGSALFDGLASAVIANIGLVVIVKLINKT